MELSSHPEVAESIKERFDWILVDEYQDTNPVQGALIHNLVPDGEGLTVVGDDAQSIYAFRAATVRNILDFPKQFKNVRKIALERNYRSTDNILDVSNQVISEAREWHKKKLWTDRKANARPLLKTCFNEAEQSNYVVQEIRKNVARGIALEEQAVLIRS